MLASARRLPLESDFLDAKGNFGGRNLFGTKIRPPAKPSQAGG